MHVIRQHHDAADFTALVREIMLADAATYCDGFPAYRDDLLAKTLRAIAGIAANAGFAGDDARFKRDMVYGEAPDFAIAVTTLGGLAAHLRAT